MEMNFIPILHIELQGAAGVFEDFMSETSGRSTFQAHNRKESTGQVMLPSRACCPSPIHSEWHQQSSQQIRRQQGTGYWWLQLEQDIVCWISTDDMNFGVLEETIDVGCHLAQIIRDGMSAISVLLDK
jgi:hypothetical protein